MTNELVLEARGINRSYGAKVALQNVDLCLRRGEVLGLLGLNGAGKSTLLQILAGALGCDSGEVSVCGHPLSNTPAAGRRSIGFAPEIPPLVPDETVETYLFAIARWRGLADEAAEAVARTVDLCGLGDSRQTLLRHLSRGYQQRAGIAQALIHSPEVIILDEPTSALDPRQIQDVRGLIKTLSEHAAVLISTHILGEVRAIADRIVILHQGRVVTDQPAVSNADVVRVRFRRTVSATELESLPGLEVLSDADDNKNDAGHWRLRLPDSVRDQFVATAVHREWGLFELAPEQDRLEQLFMQATAGKSPVESTSQDAGRHSGDFE